MPQLMPLNWISFLFFLSMLIIMLMMIYYSINKMNIYMFMKEKKSKMMWLW